MINMELTFYGLKAEPAFGKNFSWFLCEVMGEDRWQSEDLWQIRLIRSMEIAEKHQKIRQKEMPKSIISVIEIKLTL